MQLWRNTGGSVYQLLANHPYTYNNTKFETTESLALADYVSVVAGDVIGWYSDDTDMIPYDSNNGGGGGGGSGAKQITNTLVSVGASIGTPSDAFTVRQYAVKATLGPGNLPSFTNLDASIPMTCHSVTSGSVVYTVTATDADVSDTLTLALNSVTPSSHFNFNTLTGQITANTFPLSLTTYNVDIDVNDGCSTTTSTLSIVVSNNNPFFTNLAATISVGCYTPPNTNVYTVTTADSDGVNDTLTTSLTSISPSNHFAFDAVTGVVTVSTASLTTGTYTLDFTVTDLCGASATSTLTITVTNNSPFFSNLDAKIYTHRSTPQNTILYTVTTSDIDVIGGDATTAALGSTTPASHFSYDTFSANVSVSTASLFVTDYTLTFTVTDSCGLSATNTLTISVTNQAPVITSLPTTVDVSESETSSILLHTVAFTDADNDDVSCAISSTVPASAPFLIKFINNGGILDNGIYLADNAGLDYSSVNTYTLSVNCSDGYEHDVKILYVYIVQNGMPLISNLQNSTSVTTTTGVGTEVFAVAATDSEGDQMTFTLTCTNTATCPFQIYSTGRILLSQSLLGTSDLFYELDITVSDAFSTSASHRLSVVVADLNVAPVLTNLPQTLQVSEDTVPGSSLFFFSVYDADGDVSFTFDFVTTPASGAAKFVITDSTKTLSLVTTQSLDYETVSQYVLNVTATDGAATSEWRLLTVDVADINEPPVLLQSSYFVAYPEGAAGTFNLPVMLVSDPDLGDTLTFSYEAGSSSSCGLLTLNVNTGVMGYASSYDVDDTSLTTYFTCLIKVEDSGGLSVTATTTVSILDINDNQPLFTASNYVLTALQTTGVGTTLATLSVVDNDRTSANSQVIYTLTQTASYFGVTTAGVLTLTADLSAVAIGTTLSATVSVNNLGYNVSDTATIQLTVVSDGSDDDFWDSDANIAWVTLTCVTAVALTSAVGYLLWKYKPWNKAGNGRFMKVKPTGESKLTRNPMPRPREDYMRHPQTPYQGSQGRVLTPTEVKLADRWDAWGNPPNSRWNP